MAAPEREHPDHAALRHGIRIELHRGLCQRLLDALGIDTPAGLHSNILCVVDLVRDRHADDARSWSAAATATRRSWHRMPGTCGHRCHRRTPARRPCSAPTRTAGRERVGPGPLAGCRIPGLQLADMIGASATASCCRISCPARAVRRSAASSRPAIAPHMLSSGGDIEQMRLIAVGCRKASPCRPTATGRSLHPCRGRLVVLVVGRAAGLRVEAFEGVLIDERLGRR